MQATKTYRRVSFPSKIIRRAIELFKEIETSAGADEFQYDLKYELGDEAWYPTDIEEWLAEYAKLPSREDARVEIESGGGQALEVWRTRRGNSNVDVRARSKAHVQQILNLFNEVEDECRLPSPPVKPPAPPDPPVVFLGHGHSGDWRKIKDHLHEKHGYKVEAYEVGSRAGHTIRDVLDNMLDRSSFALLVMTAEDDVDGNARARQNVVHEAGLFQGRLGFNRAIAVVEDGVEVLSNLHGVDQIRYPSGHVENTFGEILAVIRREFGDAR